MASLPRVKDVHPSVSRHAIGRALVAAYESFLEEPFSPEIARQTARLEAALSARDRAAGSRSPERG